jgi:hypothetical protein
MLYWNWSSPKWRDLWFAVVNVGGSIWRSNLLDVSLLLSLSRSSSESRCICILWARGSVCVVIHRIDCITRESFRGVNRVGLCCSLYRCFQLNLRLGARRWNEWLMAVVFCSISNRKMVHSHFSLLYGRPHNYYTLFSRLYWWWNS